MISYIATTDTLKLGKGKFANLVNFEGTGVVVKLYKVIITNYCSDNADVKLIGNLKAPTDCSKSRGKPTVICSDPYSKAFLFYGSDAEIPTKDCNTYINTIAEEGVTVLDLPCPIVVPPCCSIGVLFTDSELLRPEVSVTMFFSEENICCDKKPKCDNGPTCSFNN